MPPEREAENTAKAKTRGLPEIGFAARPKLAVIGGGPSVTDHIDELRAWDGDIWASGSSFPWTLKNGIDATFFTIDQHPSLANDCRGAKRAVIATCCDPGVFDELAQAKVETFDLVHEGDGCNHFATSVTSTLKVGIDAGYREIHFFGCDSSIRGQTHAYYNEEVDQLVVEIDGQSFTTWASMLLQAEFMATVIKLGGKVFKNRSTGLLEAMVASENPLDYDITVISRNLAQKIGIAA